MTTTKRQTREIGPLTLRADVVTESIDEEARTVDLVWTTGAQVKRGYWDPYLEELSLESGHIRMARLESGSAPLLNSHRSGTTSDVIGVVESASVTSSDGLATVRFAKDPESEAIFQKVKDKILRNVSVGYRVHKLEKTESGEADETAQLPVYRAIDWEPYEISIVPIGADADAQIRNEPKTNSCEFINPLAEERSMTKKKNDENTSPAIADTAAAASNLDAGRAEGVAAERARLSVIQRTATSLELDPEFTRKHIEAGTSSEVFQGAAFDEFEKRKALIVADTARPSIEAGEDRADKQMRGMTNWIIVRSGLAKKVRDAAKLEGKTVDLDPGDFRGMKLLDMGRDVLEANGKRLTGSNSREQANQILQFRSGMHTTSDFANILENAMNKVLQASYAIAPMQWSRFAATGSVNDFRAHPRYRVGSLTSLDAVAEGGEFTRKSIADGEKESITATTKGNIIVFSRQALINDDMGAFSDTGAKFGIAASRTIEAAVFALLAENSGLGPNMADGNPLFDASHNNLGAGGALSVASLDENDAVMGAQMDPNGVDYLDLQTEILLVPRGLKKTALLLNESEFDVDTSTRKAHVPNTVRGLFSDIVAANRLSGTRRYLFADPSITPTIEVAFLDGQQEPYLEMKEGWDSDGLEWKARFDFGVAAVDYRGAVTDSGS